MKCYSVDSELTNKKKSHYLLQEIKKKKKVERTKYVIWSKNEVLCAEAGSLAAEDSECQIQKRIC
jgi:hypothetical protein